MTCLRTGSGKPGGAESRSPAAGSGVGWSNSGSDLVRSPVGQIDPLPQPVEFVEGGEELFFDHVHLTYPSQVEQSQLLIVELRLKLQ